MKAILKNGTILATAAALIIGIIIGINVTPPVLGEAQQFQNKNAMYTVVHTEGTNLIVTNNQINTVYYYTIDEGAEPGSNLKLRGSIDLDQVGKKVITPKLFIKK